MQDKLIKTLSRRNTIRRYAEKMVKGQTPSHIGDLLLALAPGRHRSWQEQIVALEVLDELTLSDFERQRAAELLAPIVAECRSQPDRKGRTKRWMVRSQLLSLMVTAGFAAVYLPDQPSFGGSGLAPYEALILLFLTGFIVLAPIVWPFSEVVEDIRFCRVRAGAVRTLGNLRFPSMAGLLARALTDSSGGRKRAGSAQVRLAAAEALPPTLALLTSDDYGRLDGQLVAQLCQALPYANETVGLALLTALEKVGDSRAVRSLEQIAARSAHHAWRAEATRILPMLLARQEQENAAKMLLRASGASASAPAVLLRPAGNNQPPDPQLLLRPGAQPSDFGC